MATHPDFNTSDYVMLSVSDTGCGMDEETIQKIFDPFFTTKDQGKGTGLGLATVYGILKQHDGDIAVESQPGIGTTFRIYLKKTNETIATADNNNKKTEPVSNGETILVIEDEIGVRQLTRRMLQRLGYKVLDAGTAKESLELASQTKHIDLLLTDLVMPEMNGRQLSEHILAIHPKIKILYMSGYTEDVIGSHGILEEGVHLINKPFSKASLSQKIRTVLNSK